MTTVILEKASYPEGSELVPLGSTGPSASTITVPAFWERGTKRRKARALQARRPLDISLTQTQGGQWVADERVTLQFGVGTAPTDAVADLMETLIEYREILRARRYRLAPYLREHLIWLESALA